MKVYKYCYIAIVLLTFYTLGMVLSYIIDWVFPVCNTKLLDKRIIIETIGEIVVVYIIFYFFKKYITEALGKVFYKLTKYESTERHSSLIFIAFSYGIFKYLDQLKEKTTYLKEKYLA